MIQLLIEVSETVWNTTNNIITNKQSTILLYNLNTRQLG